MIKPCVQIFLNNPKIDTVKSKAIFQKDKIWKAGQTGNITITFGTNSCSGCGTGASWSLIGTDCNSQLPSCNLGFIDPPTDSFTWNGVTYTSDQFVDEDGTTPSFRNGCHLQGCEPCVQKACGQNGDCKSTCPTCNGPKNTCQYGWVRGATILHEIGGHALGMVHEHQNNLRSSNPIKLNVDNVYSYYENCIGGMTKESADVNTINWYSDDSQYIGSNFDPDSIMLYYLPDCWIADGTTNPTKPNYTLSKLDKQWLQLQYPIDSKNMPKLKVQFLDGMPWKKAFVQYIISTDLVPYVGVQFYFYDSDLKPLSNTENIAKIPVPVGTQVQTSQPLTVSATTVNQPQPTSTDTTITKAPLFKFKIGKCKECSVYDCTGGKCKFSCENTCTQGQLKENFDTTSIVDISMLFYLLGFIFLVLFLILYGKKLVKLL